MKKKELGPMIENLAERQGAKAELVKFMRVLEN